MDDDAQLWGGAGLIALGTLILFAPIVVDLGYTMPLLVAGIFVLAAGAILVGLSRGGRPI